MSRASNSITLSLESLHAIGGLAADCAGRALSVYGVAVVLFGEVRIFHRLHPAPDTDKGTVASARRCKTTG